MIGELQAGATFVPFRKLRGCIVPEAFLRNRGLSRGAGQLYGQLARYAGEDGNCFPSQDRLAWDFDSSLRTIQRWLAELVGAKLVRSVRRANGRGNRYEFIWSDIFDRGQMLLIDGGQTVENRSISEPSARHNWRVAGEPSLCEESTLPRNSREVKSIPILDGPKSPARTADSEEIANRFETKPADAVAVALILAQPENQANPAPIPPAPAAIAAPDNVPPPSPPDGFKSAPMAENTVRPPSVSQKPPTVSPKAQIVPHSRQFQLSYGPIVPADTVSPDPRPDRPKTTVGTRIGSTTSHLLIGRKPPGLVRAADILAQWRGSLAEWTKRK